MVIAMPSLDGCYIIIKRMAASVPVFTQTDLYFDFVSITTLPPTRSQLSRLYSVEPDFTFMHHRNMDSSPYYKNS